MKQITKENYTSIEKDFEGIIVAYPKIDLYSNAEFYMYGYYINNENKFRYQCTAYNMEDGCIDGISSFKTSFVNLFNDFEHYDYYQFENFKELCEWYLNEDKKFNEMIDKTKQQFKSFEKEWIHEKCGTNTPPPFAPEHPSKGNKKPNKSVHIDGTIQDRLNDLWNSINKTSLTTREKSELYDILKSREEHVHKVWQNYMDNLDKMEKVDGVLKSVEYNKDMSIKEIQLDCEQDFEELNKQNKEQIYWEIYNDPNCDEGLKKKILEDWPEFENKLPKYILNNFKQEPPTGMEIPDYFKPKLPVKRREKYKDIIRYIELYVRWALASQRKNITVGEIKPLYDAVENWLDVEEHD